MRARAFLLAVAALLWPLQLTAADDPETLIRRGVELRKQGRNNDALVFLQQAYDTAHSARSAAQLGLCLAAVGRPLEAEARLNEALISQSDPWVNRQRGTLEKALAVAQSELATVTFKRLPPGAIVQTNGESRTAEAESISVLSEPGDISIAVNAPGFQPYTTRRKVVKGQSVIVEPNLKADVKKVPAEAMAPQVALPVQSSSQVGLHAGTDSTTDEATPLHRKTWFWVAAGAVASVIVVGVVMVASPEKTEFTGIMGEGPVIRGQ